MVISIISLLIAILLPALGSARKAAQQVLCMNNLKQLTVAISMYGNDSKGYYPPALYDDSPQTPEMSWMKNKPNFNGYNGYRNWISSLYQYASVPKVFACPSAPFNRSGWSYGWAMYSTPIINVDGTLTMHSTVAGVMPHYSRIDFEKFRNNKILVAPSRAAVNNTSPQHREAFTKANYAPMLHGNGTTLNVILVESLQVKQLQFTSPAFNDPTQSWFDLNKESRD